MLLKRKNKESNFNAIDLTLGILCIMQIGFLLVYNLLQMDQIVDFDSSAYFILAEQIVRQKTLTPAHYYYTTQLLWDSPLFLTALLYRLTGHIFLAAGIANDVLIGIFAWILYRLSKHMGLSVRGRRINLLAVFTLYQFGYVDYGNEMFINAAWYGVRIAAMLLFVDVILCLHSRDRDGSWIFCYILCLLEFFVSGISAGIFALGCSILPVILYEFFHLALSEKKPDLKECRPMLATLVAAVVSLSGVVVNHVAGLMPASSQSMQTVAADRLLSNLAQYVDGYFQLMGWPSEQTKLLSIGGITAVVCFFAAVVYGLLLLKALAGYCKTSILHRQMSVEEMPLSVSQNIYIGILFWMTIVDIALLTLVNLSYSDQGSEYRYWLILVIPSMLLAGIAADRIQVHGKQTAAVCTALWLLALFLINGVRDCQLWRVRSDGDTIREVYAYLDTEGVKYSYIYTDYFTGRVAASFVPEGQEAFPTAEDTISDDGRDWVHNQLRMQHWGSYVRYDGDCTDAPDDQPIGIVLNGTYPEQEAFLQAHAQTSDRIGHYTVLVMDQSYMDYVYGLPKKGHSRSRDYFNLGYTMQGLSLNDEGDLTSDGRGGEILSGTFTADSNGVYSVRLQYSLTGQAAKITVHTQSGDFTANLSENAQETTISSIPVKVGEQYTISIEEPEGTVVTLHQADYQREQ